MLAHQYQKIGEYHTAVGQECQDALLFWEDERFAVIAAADGVTACPNAREGAQLTCRGTADFVRREQERIFGFSHRALAYLLTNHILYCLEQQTGKAGTPLEDYASTLAAAVLDKQTGQVRLFNLGDGTVLSLTREGLKAQLAPRRRRGQPCQITTQGAVQAMEVAAVSLEMGDTLILCTDGVPDTLGSLTVADCLTGSDFRRLDTLLDRAANMDDCSYIALTRTL